MFDKMKQPATTEPKKAKYYWSEFNTSMVHMFTISALLFTTIDAMFFFCQFWKHKILAQVWVVTGAYAAATLWAFCWAVCWWRVLCPKLVTARKPLKDALSVGDILWILLFLAIDMALLEDSPAGAQLTMCFLLGALYISIAREFIVVWLLFRKSNYYKRITYIEFCNTPMPSNE